LSLGWHRYYRVAHINNTGALDRTTNE